MKKKISLVLMALILFVTTISFNAQPVNAATSSNENLEVSYVVQKSLPIGATVKISIKNKGTTAVNGWTLDFAFPGNQQIINSWGGSHTQTGKAVKIKNADYNGAIAAGSSVEFGMNIFFLGGNKAPSEFTVTSQQAGSGSQDKPSTDESSQDKPSTDEPSIDKPSTNKPLVEKPLTNEPSTDKPSTDKPTNSPKFHCFLLLGQSNMAGYPKAQASDKVKDDRILVLGYDNNSSIGRVKDKWDVASAPLHEAWNGAVGPGDWFAKTLINKVPAGDTIGLVPCAISGEKIETFMKGGSKYQWILNRAKLVQEKGGVIDGIIFHQGESNSGDSSWPGKVNTLVTDLRKDLNIGDVPFIAGELLRTGACKSHNTLVNKLPSVIKNCSVVSSEGLAGDPNDTWNLHFGHDAQVTLGKRYAEEMSKALKW